MSTILDVPSWQPCDRCGYPVFGQSTCWLCRFQQDADEDDLAELERMVRDAQHLGRRCAAEMLGTGFLERDHLAKVFYEATAAYSAAVRPGAAFQDWEEVHPNNREWFRVGAAALFVAITESTWQAKTTKLGNEVLVREEVVR